MRHVVVGVITCRRPEWLSRLLDSLLKQKVREEIKITIAVVDNANDDKTRKVVESKKVSNASINLLYDIEPEPGIVFARNKCVSLCQSLDADFLAFIDDDEWLEQDNWINTLLEASERYNCDIVTSRVVSVGESGTPDWAVNLIYGKNPYSEGEQVPVFYTNNLLLSKNVLEATAPCFDKRFAMTGASDYHFALRCNHLGFRCVYTEAPVHEEFPKSRATVKWFCRRGFRSGIGYTRSHLFEETYIKALVRVTFMTMVRLGRSLLSFVQGIVTLNKTKLVDGLFRLCSAAGSVAGFFGIKHEEYKVIHGK